MKQELINFGCVYKTNCWVSDVNISSWQVNEYDLSTNKNSLIPYLSIYASRCPVASSLVDSLIHMVGTDVAHFSPTVYISVMFHSSGLRLRAQKRYLT